jgi:hypothetical protein
MEMDCEFDEAESVGTFMEESARETWEAVLAAETLATATRWKTRTAEAIEPTELVYPIRVVTRPDPDWEASRDTRAFDLLGCFDRPVEAWTYACDEEYVELNKPTWEPVRAELRAHRAEGKAALQRRMDAYALGMMLMQLLEHGEAYILLGDAEWDSFQETREVEALDETHAPPEGWRAVPIACGHEDYPCCGCADILYTP